MQVCFHVLLIIYWRVEGVGSRGGYPGVLHVKRAHTPFLFYKNYINFSEPHGFLFSRAILDKFLATSTSKYGFKYIFLHGKCLRTVFSHELIKNSRTSERSERVSEFLINECENTVADTYHAEICLFH